MNAIFSWNWRDIVIAFEVEVVIGEGEKSVEVFIFVVKDERKGVKVEGEKEIFMLSRTR